MSKILISEGNISGRAEPVSDWSDADLMLSIGEQDDKAFAELVDRYGKRLFRVAWRVLGQREDSEDVVQTVFMNLWRRQSWRPGGGAAPASWLYRMAINAAIDLKRKATTDELPEDVPDHQYGDNHDLYNGGDHLQTIVQRAMAKLPKRQREVLILCYFEELSQKMAAEVMGTTVKALESLSSRARKSLKIELEAAGVKVDDL